MWVAFALQKLLTFFQQKISAYLHITNDVVSFEHLGPGTGFQIKKTVSFLQSYLYIVDLLQTKP